MMHLRNYSECFEIGTYNLPSKKAHFQASKGVTVRRYERGTANKGAP